MSDLLRIPDLLSEEEYLAADAAREDARLEYVVGHVFAHAGATKRHAQICANLVGLLLAATEGADCRVYQSDVRLRVSREMYFYPDVVVACGGDPREEDPVNETAPVFLAEVLSGNTAERDLGLKLVVYRNIRSLRTYLIVSQDERRVECHWRAEPQGEWREEVISGSGTITVPSLGAEITLERIYARLER